MKAEKVREHSTGSENAPGGYRQAARRRDCYLASIMKIWRAASTCSACSALPFRRRPVPADREWEAAGQGPGMAPQATHWEA